VQESTKVHGIRYLALVSLALFSLAFILGACSSDSDSGSDADAGGRAGLYDSVWP